MEIDYFTVLKLNRFLKEEGYDLKLKCESGCSSQHVLSSIPLDDKLLTLLNEQLKSKFMFLEKRTDTMFIVKSTLE